MTKSNSLYYGHYLQLPTLLKSQGLESSKQGSPAHDEMLFIITHQTYELWFKQILFELDSIISLFSAIPLDEAKLQTIAARLERITRIQKVINQQINILETMTALDFLDFRDFLIPASGFQSVQFRELELRLGLAHHQNVCPYGRFNDDDSHYLQTIAQQPSLFEQVNGWLERMPFLVFGEYRFWESYREAVEQMLDSDTDIIDHNPLLDEHEKQQQRQTLNTTRTRFDCLFDPEMYSHQQSQGQFQFSHPATLAALFIQLYRDLPLLQLPFKVLTLLMDIDALLTHWRSAHALMVERMLGSKIGTGGSSGQDYLKSTLSRKRIFADLCNLSTFLIPRSRLPKLPESLVRNLGFYQQRR